MRIIFEAPYLHNGARSPNGHVTYKVSCLVITIAKDDNNIAAVQF